MRPLHFFSSHLGKEVNCNMGNYKFSCILVLWAFVLASYSKYFLISFLNIGLFCYRYKVVKHIGLFLVLSCFFKFHWLISESTECMMFILWNWDFLFWLITCSISVFALWMFKKMYFFVIIFQLFKISYFSSCFEDRWDKISNYIC